jgi:UDP-N-acetyl-2-amino-2-deoxyglucuronate dehydrogenase
MSERMIPADRPIRLALIGCGRIAKNHFEAIAKLDDVELVSVCDVVESRARDAGAAQGVPWFTNLDQMLAQVPSDAVVVATPSGLHPVLRQRRPAAM